MSRSLLAANILLFSSLATATSTAAAAAAPPVGKTRCTSEGLTGSCAFFKSRPEAEIRLPDGTAFRNPTVLQRTPSAAAPSDADLNEKSLRARIKAIRAWDPLPKDDRVSDGFRLSLETQLDNVVLGFAFGEPAPGGAAPSLLSPTPTLAWPPGDADAKPRKISREELAAYVAKLPDEVKTNVREAIHAFRELTTAAPAPTAPIAPPISPARAARLQELAEYARQTLLTEIQAGRDSGQLNAEELAQLEKIRSVKVRAPSEVANLSVCAGVSPDAANNPITHSLALCPSFANYPDSQLVFLFAHEMSHSIDPCLMQFPLLRLNREKLAQLAPSQIPSEIANDPDRAQILAQLKALPTGTELSNFEALFVLKNPFALKYFLEKGFVTEQASAITFEKNPSWAAYSCLRGRGDFRETRATDLGAFASVYAESVNAASPTEVDRSKLRSDLEAAMARYPQCAPTLAGGSQMNEVMADAWGAKVLGAWLQAHPPKDDLQKIAAISTFAEDVCVPSRPVAAPTGVAKPSELARQVEAFPRDDHPPSRQRLNFIVLTEPRVQAALACQASSPYPSCLALLGGSSALSRLRPTGVVR